ncbi:MAG TPA: hypothetical protein VEG08_02785 [Terriglobales bacterium]|nr:hypothetical protein [Terriglobales bacterium]
MRLASLLVLLLMATLLCAQETPSALPPQAAVEPAPPPPEAAPAAPAAQPAPVLGHPLDPADVATLTAPSSTSVPAYARTSSSYYPPYLGGYPAEVPLFGGSQLSASTWRTPMFSPLGFGRRNFFVFGHPGFGPPFFSPGGPGFVGFRPHHGGHHH